MTGPTEALLYHFDTIPEDERTAALNGKWYRESRRTARALARKHGTTLATAAGVLAALSPRIQWRANVAAADKVLGGQRDPSRVAGFDANIDKAFRIADGEKPLSVLGGPKVTAFYRAIMGDEDAGVVDVWMWRAMGYAPGEVSYAVAEAHLREAASQAGLPVSTFQAIVWTKVRGRP